MSGAKEEIRGEDIYNGTVMWPGWEREKRKVK